MPRRRKPEPQDFENDTEAAVEWRFNVWMKRWGDMAKFLSGLTKTGGITALTRSFNPRQRSFVIRELRKLASLCRKSVDELERTMRQQESP
jgi:hypothetical protein